MSIARVENGRAGRAWRIHTVSLIGGFTKNDSDTIAAMRTIKDKAKQEPENRVHRDLDTLHAADE